MKRKLLLTFTVISAVALYLQPNLSASAPNFVCGYDSEYGCSNMADFLYVVFTKGQHANFEFYFASHKRNVSMRSSDITQSKIKQYLDGLFDNIHVLQADNPAFYYMVNFEKVVNFEPRNNATRTVLRLFNQDGTGIKVRVPYSEIQKLVARFP